PDDFTSDLNKMLYVLSYLWGPAAKSFEPDLMKPQNLLPLWTTSFLTFTEELIAHFSPVDLCGDSEHGL
ncbi:hypothetical protein DL96DRAFT_1460504, partial [Flagelloscypha sp. PMI_526]